MYYEARYYETVYAYAWFSAYRFLLAVLCHSLEIVVNLSATSENSHSNHLSHKNVCCLEYLEKKMSEFGFP